MKTDEIEGWTGPVFCNVGVGPFVSAACGDEDGVSASKELSHEGRFVAPPVWRGCDVVVEMTLSFVLDVEGEDVRSEMNPTSVSELGIAVVEDVCDAIIEVGLSGGRSVPGCYVVEFDGLSSAIYRGQVVLGHVGVVAPTA